VQRRLVVCRCRLILPDHYEWLERAKGDRTVPARTRWIVLAAVMLFSVVAVTAVSSQVFLFTETLRSVPLDAQEGTSHSSYDVAFFDQLDQRVAAASVHISRVIPSSTGDHYQMMVSIWHAHTGPGTEPEDLQADTRLRSLRVRINAGAAASTVRLSVPGGSPWEPVVRFYRAQQGEGVVLDIPDLGFQGRGTVTLEFLVGDWGLPPPEQFTVDVAFTMYEGRLVKLTKLDGQTTITVQRPDGLEQSSTLLHHRSDVALSRQARVGPLLPRTWNDRAPDVR
jgi:hypothetical protein